MEVKSIHDRTHTLFYLLFFFSLSLFYKLIVNNKPFEIALELFVVNGSLKLQHLQHQILTLIGVLNVKDF